MDSNEATPTPLEDQDKIRLKRIAKLQQQQQSTNAQAQTPPPQAQPPKRKTETAPAAQSPLPRPKPITVHPAGTGTRFVEPFEEWEDAVITRILNVTLSRDVAEASNWTAAYLKDVEQDLLAENPALKTPIRLTSEWADSLLLSRFSLSPANVTDDPEVLTVIASLPPNETLFEYLGGCWKRERAERYKLGTKKGANPQELIQRFAVLNTLKRLVVSYLGLVLDDPSTFPQDHITGKVLGALELKPLLLPSSSAPTSPTVPQSSDLPGILQDLATAELESGLASIVGPLVASSGRDILSNKLDIGGGGDGGVTWREHLSALHSLTEIKAVASALPDVKTWDITGAPGATTAGIEIFSLLGPFLRLSTFPEAFPSIASSYFPNPSDMGRGDLDSASSNLRGTLANVQTSLFRVVNNIVRSDPKSREVVLSYLGNVAKANVKRAAMQVDPATVSSHGFIINLHSILLEFATPFIDATYTKIDKIDPLYYKYSSRVDVAQVTKMSATQTESDDYYAMADGEPVPVPNFISEIFFLCTTFLHLGPMSAIEAHKNLKRYVRSMDDQVTDLEGDTTWRGTPNEAATQAHIDKFQKKREALKSRVKAYEVQLFDPQYLSRCVGFGNLVMAWLVRTVDPKTNPKKKHPHVQISLPLPEETPIIFRMLPEYLIEDLTEFLAFVSKYAPQVLADTPQDDLVTFMLVFLSTPYMNNPYLKGQFVQIMFDLTQPTHRNPRGSLGDVLNFHPLALKNLMPCLVHAYIQIEITGTHQQFWEKFKIRYFIAQLFKLVWSNPTHRKALMLESTHLDRYVRFVNLLMNDTTYLLDDAILHLGKISDIQKQMDDKAAWDARPVTERQEVEKLLRQYEGSAEGDLQYGHESLRLLKRLASETRDPFLQPEIVDRLAAMLDMNLNMLAGPRCQDLKVRDSEKYKFRPKELLSDVLQIFLELGPRLEFQEAVAKDGRSYSRDLFERADRIARKTAIKTDDELAVLKAMVLGVEAIKAAEEEDDAMGDVPDEFLDPLTYDIMRDPVLLPASKTIVDRSTIKQHYLSDASDPFNRIPLKWEDLVDATELKERISAFLAQRKANRKGAAVAADDQMVVDA